MTNSPARHRTSVSGEPPIAGMPTEVWSWLRESLAVRPAVVARVRAALDAGEQASADQVAGAMLRHEPFRHGARQS